MTKENPVKHQNRWMREHYANHLCLHCKNLSYWDWYICTKRLFKFRDFYLREIIHRIKYRLGWLMGDASLQYIIKDIFTVDQFIPEKPIRKCKFYEYSDRKVFWTKRVEQDGTTWIDDGEDNENLLA